MTRRKCGGRNWCFCMKEVFDKGQHKFFLVAAQKTNVIKQALFVLRARRYR